jgi:hypothetical protein
MADFEDGADERKSLPATAPAPGLLKKPVDTIAIVPQTTKISPLVRKLYNVLMHHAQVQGEQRVYEARFRDVINVLDFNSNNTEVIKEYCRAMVTTRVEWQSPTSAESTRWGVSGMLAHAEFFRNGSGEVVLQWSYAPVLQQAILDPQRYARVSLAFVSQLRTHAALVLYEICSRYVNVGRTAREHWTWWRPVLTGTPEGTDGAYNEWKYFKRDCIAKAVAEVNLVTDLQIAPIEHRQGRAMGDLQFDVKPKVQQKLPLRALPDPIDLEDIGRAIALGVGQAKAEKLYERYGVPAFKSAVAALAARIERKNLEPVRDPEKFLASILAAPASAEPALAKAPPESVKETKAKRIALLENYRQHKRKEAESLFSEKPSAEQKALIQRYEAFLKGTPAAERTYKSRGLQAPLTRAMFLKFISDDFFGEGWENPSDTVLLEHAIS